MKRSIARVLTLILAVLIGEAWAGPAEEVAQISGTRPQAFLDGNVDAYTAAFADNAVFKSAVSPFRIEGKEAIRAFFAQLFQMYPKRNLFIRQPVARVYNDDLVIQNFYAVFNVTNEKGEARTYDLRITATWAKFGGRWQIVDQHASRLPVTQ